MKKVLIHIAVSLIVLVALCIPFFHDNRAYSRPVKPQEVNAFAREIVLPTVRLEPEEIERYVAFEKHNDPIPGRGYSRYLRPGVSFTRVAILVDCVKYSRNNIANYLRLEMTPELRKKALFVNQLGNVESYQPLLSFVFFVDKSEMGVEELKSEILSSRVVVYWIRGFRNLDAEVGLAKIPSEEFIVKNGIVQKTISLRGIPFREKQ